MRIVKRLLVGLVVLVLLVMVAIGGWLWLVPPDLIRVGTGYSAKIVCSNVFIAGRDPEEVLTIDVQAPGHPLLRLIRINVNRDSETVEASLLGLFAASIAAYRDGLGCANVPDGDPAALDGPLDVPPVNGQAVDAPWPNGNRVALQETPEIAAILDDIAMTGPGMRAVVVVHGGRIVGERYGEGFTPDTRLLGWSMTKTVTAAIIGTLIKRERLALDQNGLFNVWLEDERSAITLADMLAMSSGLEFNEDYGTVADVTRMLYLEPDMAAFASSKPLAHPVGTVFNYSSGTSVMLARVWQNAIGDEAEALAWPRKALFAPLGMKTAVMETDARGTFVGSSYTYASARDWARFGLFLLREGVWDGQELLPPGYVGWMREDAPASDGRYGRGHVWKHGPAAGTRPGEHPDAGFNLPDDAFWLLGHDGQSMVVIPSEDLVVLRLGLTPWRMGYKPQRMIEALIAALN